MAPAKLLIEVVYVEATPGVRVVWVDIGTSVLDAIRLSEILRDYPKVDLCRQRVGIFGRLVALSEPVKSGDRIEIYEPLPEDPKDARRRRARAKTRARNASRKCAVGSAAVCLQSSSVSRL